MNTVSDALTEVLLLHLAISSCCWKPFHFRYSINTYSEILDIGRDADWGFFYIWSCCFAITIASVHHICTYSLDCGLCSSLRVFRGVTYTSIMYSWGSLSLWSMLWNKPWLNHSLNPRSKLWLILLLILVVSVSPASTGHCVWWRLNFSSSSMLRPPASIPSSGSNDRPYQLIVNRNCR